ncbi:hypothetical protein [Microbacterium sp.]|uniref:hypothetical protein n=1 Tax=Microbacterium sp. TaxID=51671 RepID=UPI0039E46646
MTPEPAPHEHELAVLDAAVSIDTAAIEIIGGQTQQIEISLPVFIDDDHLAVDEVVRDDHVLRDEQPPAPPTARELAAGIIDGPQAPGL